MPWLRVGDNMATHPTIGKLLASTNFDHAVKNECIGVLTQLAATSGAHLTDGLINTGSMAQVAPGREREVLSHFVEAEIAKEIYENDKLVAVQLILDDEDFFHIKSKEEYEQDNARKRDYRKPGLWAQVRMRDGDACRWCGKSVSWSVKSGYRKATIDSLNGHKDSTPETLVVACGQCNSARGGGAEYSLLAPPERPIYGKHTVDFVKKDKWCQDNGIEIELTNPQLAIDFDTAKTADTLRSASAAHSETTGASPAESESVEMPEWVEATSERMNEIWSKTADTLRSGQPPAHSETTGASDEPKLTPENSHGEEVADTPRSASAAHSEVTGAQPNHEVDQEQTPPKTADTLRSGQPPAHSETT
ncbi:hypothetical protein, partial [Corynebacterium sp.]|uniref:HNH endonuclease n=1 Tax=Corynebacterium sp. TaxID=1720 RepID=UPI0028A8C48F